MRLVSLNVLSTLVIFLPCTYWSMLKINNFSDNVATGHGCSSERMCKDNVEAFGSRISNVLRMQNQEKRTSDESCITSLEFEPDASIIVDEQS